MRLLRDETLRVYLKVQSVFILTMALHRLAFLLWYGEPGLVSSSSLDLLKAFWLGFRFDALVLVYANSLPIVVYLFLAKWPHPRLWTAWKWGTLGLWSLTFLLIQVLAVMDFFYFKHFQDRFNVVLMGLFTDDTEAVVLGVWKNYPLGSILLLWALAGISGFLLFRRWLKSLIQPRAYSWGAWLVTVVVVISLTAIIGRGSFSFYPLGQIHTQVSSNPFINLLTVNAPFRLKTAVKQYFEAKGLKGGNIHAFGFAGQEPRAFELGYGHYVPSDPIASLKRTSQGRLKFKPHVVIVLMESLGSYWFQFDRDPFDLVGPLGRHLRDSAFTLRMVPGSVGTIGSLTSILSGVPHGSRSAFLSESQYQSYQMPTSPALFFADQGYKTRFIYAGSLGWRGIGAFARRQGFAITDGEAEIERVLGPGPGARHDWGIHDDRVFTYLTSVLETATTPEFIVVMTTSNHPPFEVPASYLRPAVDIPAALKANLLVDEKLAQARFTALRFSVDSLSHFLDSLTAKNQMGKIALAISGDHGFWFARIASDQVAQRFQVPFALWLPTEELTTEARRRLQEQTLGHLHILPTLYDLVPGKLTYFSFLPSLFSGQPLVGHSSQNFSLAHDGGVTLDYPPAARCYKDSAAQLPLLNTCSTKAPEALVDQYKAYMAGIDFFLEAVRRSNAVPIR